MGIGPDLDQEVSFHLCSKDSVQSRSEGLMPSDGSHLGSVSANSIGLDSIGDPLAKGLSDQDQQERGGGEGLNLAVEMEILGPEFGSEDPIVNMDANDEEGNDRDSADYSTTIRTNRFYLSICCCVFSYQK